MQDRRSWLKPDRTKKLSSEHLYNWPHSSIFHSPQSFSCLSHLLLRIASLNRSPPPRFFNNNYFCWILTMRRSWVGDGQYQSYWRRWRRRWLRIWSCQFSIFIWSRGLWAIASNCTISLLSSVHIVYPICNLFKWVNCKTSIISSSVSFQYVVNLKE